VNAEIYKLSLDFDYLEINGTDTAQKTVNWVIQNNIIRGFGTNFIEIDQQSNAFFEHLRTALEPVSGSTRRVAGEIRVYVTAGSKTLATYYLVNNNFSAITQTRPEYDNVTNGTGLFASRRTVTTKAKMLQPSVSRLRSYLPNYGF